MMGWGGGGYIEDRGEEGGRKWVWLYNARSRSRDLALSRSPRSGP